MLRTQLLISNYLNMIICPLDEPPGHCGIGLYIAADVYVACLRSQASARFRGAQQDLSQIRWLWPQGLKQSFRWLLRPGVHQSNLSARSLCLHFLPVCGSFCLQRLQCHDLVTWVLSPVLVYHHGKNTIYQTVSARMNLSNLCISELTLPFLSTEQSSMTFRDTHPHGLTFTPVGET